MLCNNCKTVKMVPGQVIIPIWGRTDGQRSRRGDTLNQVGSMLGPCMKCPQCGHSVTEKVTI